ncbi:12628_t:CDS:2, partial [Entrophospora sp. SA101]
MQQPQENNNIESLNVLTEAETVEISKPVGFWGLVLTSNSPFTHVASRDYTITMAAFDSKLKDDKRNGPSSGQTIIDEHFQPNILPNDSNIMSSTSKVDGKTKNKNGSGDESGSNDKNENGGNDVEEINGEKKQVKKRKTNSGNKKVTIEDNDTNSNSKTNEEKNEAGLPKSPKPSNDKSPNNQEKKVKNVDGVSITEAK